MKITCPGCGESFDRDEHFGLVVFLTGSCPPCRAQEKGLCRECRVNPAEEDGKHCPGCIEEGRQDLLFHKNR